MAGTGKKRATPKPAPRVEAAGKGKRHFAMFTTVQATSAPAFAPKLAKEGVAPEVGTVVYVHGIGNKPVASVLKCQWDTVLFGAAMGDRTRLAYWVDRARYPVPEPGTCAGHDVPSGEDAGPGVRALGGEEAGEPPASAEERRFLAAVESRLREGGREGAPRGPGAKILPLPEGVRRWVTRRLTELFLEDVRDFFFKPDRRALMERSLLDRLETGGGPFIVVAHSQGSMIAYHVLRQLSKAQCDVRLLVTIGSPLGIQEVQDQLKRMAPQGALAVPDCVDAWLNVAERLDPVAIDAVLSNDFTANGRGVEVEDEGGLGINREWRENPHSATGYLAVDSVRSAVRKAAGTTFANLVGRNVVMRDLVNDLEDGWREQRHPTLIQLASGDAPGEDSDLDGARERVEARIARFVRGVDAAEALRIQRLRRFVAADLTRSEIEQLRSEFADLRIERVWRNARKRALLHQSSLTVQARPANLAYGAAGRGIAWAVLDTGIAAAHPHFAARGNVVAQWDCTGTGPAARLSPGDARFGHLDGNGHGTHVAATIAGGKKLPAAAGKPEIQLDGMAPEAKLHGFKVLDDNGKGEDAWIIKALDAVADLNERAGRLVIHGVNLSLGGGFDPAVFGCGHTPLCQELRRLWRQGVLVVLAAGNEGYAILDAEGGAIPANMDLSIGDPANLEEAIAVGSIHKENPHTYGVSYFSSRGPTADGRMKPDLVAPGEKILSARHDWPAAGATARELYVEMSGTSMAAPHVSGILAAFLSARREFIGYPDRVKELLLAHCTDLARDPYIQGRGMPNLVKMLLAT